MSQGAKILQPTEEDITKLVMASVHVGTKNLNFQIKNYVYKRKADGTHLINLHKTWEKLLLAARVIVAIENPKDVFVLSSRNYGRRAILKFGANVGAVPLAGRYTPGAFTNQIQKAFNEPRLLVVNDPSSDLQPLREAALVNIPTIAFANTDNGCKFVDLIIPGNNSSIHSVGLLWWLLAREVLRFRGVLSRTQEWSVMPDLFFYRDPEEVEKEEKSKLALKEGSGFGAGLESAPQEAPAADEDWSKPPAAAGSNEEWGASSW